jgi:hypothetical protein
VRSSSGAAGTYVRDPDGVDRPPAGYFAPVRRGLVDEGYAASWVVELEEAAEERQARAAELRAWVDRSFQTDAQPARPRGLAGVDERAFAAALPPWFLVELHRRARATPVARLLALRCSYRSCGLCRMEWWPESIAPAFCPNCGGPLVAGPLSAAGAV